ncbi:CPBP family glutamic-type intramembrane protease [Runella slithyformis]|uniref:CPBP family glutamic-type intramembrane protease n=1 Tax=Runella slithyformis TaxID=106 RepID=UPI0009DAF9AC
MGADLSKLTDIQLFIVVVLVVPIIETLIFQYSIIKLSKRIFKNENIGIVISALFFSISHSYNWLYVINMLFTGIIFGYCFIDRYCQRLYNTACLRRFKTQ